MDWSQAKGQPVRSGFRFRPAQTCLGQDQQCIGATSLGVAAHLSNHSRVGYEWSIFMASVTNFERYSGSHRRIRESLETPLGRELRVHKQAHLSLPNPPNLPIPPNRWALGAVALSMGFRTAARVFKSAVCPGSEVRASRLKSRHRDLGD
jgi:hypothetical protein